MAMTETSTLYNNHSIIDQYDCTNRNLRDESSAGYDGGSFPIDKDDFDWSDNVNSNSSYKSKIHQQNNATRTSSNSYIDNLSHQESGHPNHHLDDLSFPTNSSVNLLSSQYVDFRTTDKLADCNNNLLFIDSNLNKNTSTENKNLSTNELQINEGNTEQFYDDMHILNANNIDETLACNFNTNATESPDTIYSNSNKDRTPLISSQTISLITCGIDSFQEIDDTLPYYDKAESLRNGTDHGEVMNDLLVRNYENPSNEYETISNNYPPVYGHNPLDFDTSQHNGQQLNEKKILSLPEEPTTGYHQLGFNNSDIEINAQNENSSSENSKHENIPGWYPRIFEIKPEKEIFETAANLNSKKAQTEIERQFHPDFIDFLKDDDFLSSMCIEREKLETWADEQNPFMKHDLRFLETEYWFCELNKGLQHYSFDPKIADTSLDVLLEKEISPLNIYRSPHVLRSLMKVAMHSDNEGIPSKAKILLSKLEDIYIKSGKGPLTNKYIGRRIAEMQKENNQMTFEWMFLRDVIKKKRTYKPKGNSAVNHKKGKEKKILIDNHNSSETSQQPPALEVNCQIDTSSIKQEPLNINIGSPELVGTHLVPKKFIEEANQGSSLTNMEQVNLASNESIVAHEITSPSSSPRLIICDSTLEE